jgi:hypothetical protein
VLIRGTSIMEGSLPGGTGGGVYFWSWRQHFEVIQFL